jgi:hypothetical protein
VFGQNVEEIIFGYAHTQQQRLRRLLDLLHLI